VAVTGYVYRGRKREGLPDLETLNRAILDARPPGAIGPQSAAARARQKKLTEQKDDAA
jgi:hypothetical protein